MCGRYFCGDLTAYEVEDELGLEHNSLLLNPGDVTPGMTPKVLTAANKTSASDKLIRVADMFWGIGIRDYKLVINAKAESVFNKPMFADSFESRRCVVPAAGFYEWDKDRNKVTFFKKDKGPIYLAGFYKLAGNRDSFVILTTAANDSMIRVHYRMPLMIDKAGVRDWLYNTDAAKEMLSMDMPLLDSRSDYEQLTLF